MAGPYENSASESFVGTILQAVVMRADLITEGDQLG